MESSKSDYFVLILSRKDKPISISEQKEFLDLIKAAGIKSPTVERIRVRQPHPHSYIGLGNLKKLKERLGDTKAKLLVVNIALFPNQHRNLEKALQVDIWDRTALILDIFAQRARTHQGKLQVELAQLEYQSTRLVRGWTHLERQRGAIGQRGGAGEKQLEVDRRLLRTRIMRTRKKLEKIKKQRQLGCSARKKAQLPTISLVGYTNAGKSTLFNAMSRSDAYVSHQLFATLDPTIRRARWDIGNFLLADTVGFIEDLSPNLLESFAATFSEIKHSALILHLIDISDRGAEKKKIAVHNALQYIGAETIDCITVYNKIDKRDMPARVVYDWQGNPETLWVSANNHSGLELLSNAINKRLNLQQESKLFPAMVDLDLSTTINLKRHHY